MSYIDGSLEFNDKWHVEVGPGIGGPVPFVAPTTATVVPASDSNPYMTVATTGTAYTDMMAALQRPWQPQFIMNPAAVEITMQFTLNTDFNSFTSLQALEHDLRICDAAGYNYNGSCQNNYEEGGQVQVYGVAPNPPWVNTGLMVGKYSEGVDHVVKIRYVVNTIAHTMSIPWYDLDNVRHVIPANLQNVPGQLLNWTPGLYLQLQLDLAYKGGSSVVKFKNVQCIWE
jgi:hypothetical protein